MNKFELISLPYSPDALEPVISAETIAFHHGKHLQTYVNNLNALLPGSGFEEMTLEEDRISWTEPLDNRNLECVVQLLPPGEKQRAKWISHKLVVDEPEDDWE